MQVTVKFEVDLPETFVIEKDQPFEFGMRHIRYEKAVAKNCSVVYKRTPKGGDTELVSLEEAAKEYFLAKTASDMDPENTTYLKEDTKTHTAWVMMSADNDVITDEHDTPEEAVSELLEKYTVQQMHEAGITCNKLLCDAKSWLECLEVVAY